MEIAIILVLVLPCFALLSLWIAKTNKKRRRMWELAAESLGLDYDVDVISGTIDGLQVRVTVEFGRRGKSREVVTVFTADLEDDLPEGLSIEAAGIRSKVARLMGPDHVRLGLQDLDSHLLVKANNMGEARAWARREGVADGLRMLPGNYAFLVAPDTLRFEVLGGISEPSEIRNRLRELVSIAMLISPRAVENYQFARLGSGSVLGLLETERTQDLPDNGQ